MIIMICHLWPYDNDVTMLVAVCARSTSLPNRVRHAGSFGCGDLGSLANWYGSCGVVPCFWAIVPCRVLVAGVVTAVRVQTSRQMPANGLIVRRRGSVSEWQWVQAHVTDVC